MTTDSSQVMQVLDRCLDVAGTDSSTAPKVAAAAARAKADPDMHDAISQLLAEKQEASSWESWRRALATARKYESGDLVPRSRLQRCDMGSPVNQMFISCMTASGAPSEPDNWNAAITLAELFLGIIMVEMTSLGTDEGRQLRNRAAHGDVAAALTQWRNLAGSSPKPWHRRWRNLADSPPESRHRSKPR